MAFMILLSQLEDRLAKPAIHPTGLRGIVPATVVDTFQPHRANTPGFEGVFVRSLYPHQFGCDTEPDGKYVDLRRQVVGNSISIARWYLGRVGPLH
jgi:hypothetical protein